MDDVIMEIKMDNRYSTEIVKRQTSIDVFKFIFSFVVVAIHTRPFNYILNHSENTRLIGFMTNGVLFYFLSTGWLLSKQIGNDWYSVKNINILKQHVLKILKMYILWTIIYLPIAAYYFYTQKTPIIIAVRKYLTGVLFVGENYNSYPLWYLLSTVYGLLFVIFLLKKRVSKKIFIILSVVVLNISFLITFFMDQITFISSNYYLKYVYIIIANSILHGRILLGFSYMVIGFFLVDNIDIIWALLFFLIGLLGIYFCFSNSYLLGTFLVFSSTGLFSFIKNIQIKISHNICIILRNISIGVYLIHMYVWTFYYLIVYGTKKYGIDSFLFTATVSFILSYAYARISNNNLKIIN